MNSHGDLGSILQGRLKQLQEQKVHKQAKETQKKGIEKFIDDNNSDDSDDPFAIEEGVSLTMKTADDPSKLIDLELIKLLNYCYSLKDHKEQEDYEDELMLKAFQLGKAQKSKTLIFDMDETLVAAKF